MNEILTEIKHATIIYDTIDNYDIVKSFDVPTIDPVASQREETIVYFIPTFNEKIITKEEASILMERFTTLSNHKALCTNGDIIPDYRGIQYYILEDDKWHLNTITQIGIEMPFDGVLPKDMTREDIYTVTKQSECDRIAAMTTQEKQDELTIAMSVLLNNAQNMRSRLEIMQDPDALAKTQAWYTEQSAYLKQKYF